MYPLKQEHHCVMCHDRIKYVWVEKLSSEERKYVCTVGWCVCWRVDCKVHNQCYLASEHVMLCLVWQHVVQDKYVICALLLSISAHNEDVDHRSPGCGSTVWQMCAGLCFQAGTTGATKSETIQFINHQYSPAGSRKTGCINMCV